MWIRDNWFTRNVNITGKGMKSYYLPKNNISLSRPCWWKIYKRPWCQRKLKPTYYFILFSEIVCLQKNYVVIQWYSRTYSEKQRQKEIENSSCRSKNRLTLSNRVKRRWNWVLLSFQITILIVIFYDRLFSIAVSTSDCHPRGPEFDFRLYHRNFTESMVSGTGYTQPREDIWVAIWCE